MADPVAGLLTPAPAAAEAGRDGIRKETLGAQAATDRLRPCRRGGAMPPFCLPPVRRWRRPAEVSPHFARSDSHQEVGGVVGGCHDSAYLRPWERLQTPPTRQGRDHCGHFRARERFTDTPVPSGAEGKERATGSGLLVGQPAVGTEPQGVVEVVRVPVQDEGAEQELGTWGNR